MHAGASSFPRSSPRRSVIASPALIAIRHGRGADVMCRGSLVAPKRIHQAGFHPTAVLGVMGGGGRRCRIAPDERRSFPRRIAGSMASGIIEYLAEGTSTKRMHPGWACAVRLRAVELARAGFEGPRTVWEGTHGFCTIRQHTGGSGAAHGDFASAG